MYIDRGPFDHPCHICRSRFTLERVGKPRSLAYVPARCPFCDAKVRQCFPRGPADAKAVALALCDVPPPKGLDRQTTEECLRERACTPSDVEWLLRMIDGLDYEGWRHRPASTRVPAHAIEARIERATRVEQELQKPEVRERLRIAAAVVRAELVEEQTLHLEIRRNRESPPSS